MYDIPFLTSLKGALHNSSLAERRFVKISVYHTQWTRHMLPGTGSGSGGFESLDHAALWCKLSPARRANPCHMFHCHAHPPDNWCYMGSRDVTHSYFVIHLLVVDVSCVLFWDHAS